MGDLFGWLLYGLGQSAYDRAGRIPKAERDANDAEARLTLRLSAALLAVFAVMQVVERLWR